MIITKKIVETSQREVVIDHICNMCAESCTTDSEFHSMPFFEGLINASVTGGYTSHLLGDMVQYNFDLCEKCLIKLFDGFKVPVDKKELVNVQLGLAKDFYEAVKR